jgi:ribosomal protein S18 acetylase RimI-like enzyme
MEPTFYQGDKTNYDPANMVQGVDKMEPLTREKFAEKSEKFWYNARTSDGSVVSSVWAKLGDDEDIKTNWVLRNIVTDPKFLRKEFAERLLTHVIQHLKKNSKGGDIVLYVNSKLVPAIKLYEKLGFRQAGVNSYGAIKYVYKVSGGKRKRRKTKRRH